LRTEAECVAALLSEAGVRVLATLLDNSVAWVVADLAATLAGAAHVPMPTSFTPSQARQALFSAAADAWLTSPAAAQHLGTFLQAREARRCEIAGDLLVLAALRPGMPQPSDLDADRVARQHAADGLVHATAALGLTRHLSVLPLAEPLERVAGLQAALTRGADCTVLPLRQMGLIGAAGFDAAAFHAAVIRHEPDSMVLRPALLRAWSAHLHATRRNAPHWLRLVTVAGTALGDRALMEAHAAGIPAYEGYAPSPGGLLQTLNLPGAELPGSMGRALPHARLRCTADGAIEVAAAPPTGPLPGAASPAWQPTGDNGRLDAQGFLHLTAPKADGLAGAAGRPMPADWTETTRRDGSHLAQGPCLAQPAAHS